MRKTAVFQGFFAAQGAKPASEAGLKDGTSVKPLPRVSLETVFGELVLQIDIVRAPVTAANFLRYAAAGAYDGGQFYRTVRMDNQPDNEIRIGVIQGSKREDATGYPPIALERTTKTGISHMNGTISMARMGPDTATDQFFLCIGDQPELDFGGRRNPDGQGFAAFGALLRGWLVLEQIQHAEAKGQALTPPIAIRRARLLDVR